MGFWGFGVNQVLQNTGLDIVVETGARYVIFVLELLSVMDNVGNYLQLLLFVFLIFHLLLYFDYLGP